MCNPIKEGGYKGTPANSYGFTRAGQALSSYTPMSSYSSHDPSAFYKR